MTDNKLLVIDGNSILNRAFYGVRPMTTRDGRHTNAIYGFINMIAKQLDALSPQAAAIAFDLHAPTFRHKACDFYKANRHGMPDELHEQLEPAKEASRLLGLHVLSLEGYEADDILGSCVRCAEDDTENDYTVYVLTGDRDSLQLIGPHSRVLLCTNNDTVVYDDAVFAENYGGLAPRQLIDLKALMGDSSDNIPGVPGIGEKTALKLVGEFGSLDGLYAGYESSSLSAGVKKKLADGKESAYQSQFLATIFREVPLPLTYSDLSYPGIDRENFGSFLASYELKSLLKRFGYDGPAPDPGNGHKADKAVPSEKEAGPSLFDGEPAAPEVTEALPFEDLLPVGTLPVIADGQRVGVYPAFEDGKLYLDAGALYVTALNDDTMMSLFTDRRFYTVVYDSKELYRYFLDKAIEPAALNIVFDVMLADYVVHPSVKTGIEELLTGICPPEDETQRALLCTSRLLETADTLHASLAESGMLKLYETVEFPLAPVLAKMEHEGFRLDTEGLAAYGEKLDERIAERVENICALAGGKFNINSTKQLGEVLYDRLELPTFKKTQKGFSTDAETLEKLRPYHPIIDEILDYRVVAKLRSTYVEGLLKVCDGKTGRVHTTFKQALTLTGRLSSVEPNLQNIPIKQPEGRELRRFFTAKEGHILIDADYSQIELRILAALAHDETMLEAFRTGVDIHTLTASQVFGVPEELVTPAMRKSAKAVNFGIVYGISDYALAGDIGTTKKQAGEYIDKYFATYPGIAAYLEELTEKATNTGWCETFFGRRRYVPELAAKNKVMQAFGKRVARNSPIQGTAADIIKIAMIRADEALKKAGLNARLILQVHDELVVECPVDEKDAASQILQEAMEGAADIGVPLAVSLETGDNWFEAH